MNKAQWVTMVTVYLTERLRCSFRSFLLSLEIIVALPVSAEVIVMVVRHHEHLYRKVARTFAVSFILQLEPWDG